MIITDLNGNSEMLTDYKDLQIRQRVNSEHSLSFSIFRTDKNAHSFDYVTEESTIDYNDNTYRIKNVEERSISSTSVKVVTAHHTFFDLIDEYQYTVSSGTKSLANALDFVLNGTGYTYTIVGTFDSQQFTNLGDDNVLSLFSKLIKAYNFEYEVDGTVITIKNEIGRDTDVQFRYKHNLKAISKRVDTSNLSTYIKGIGKDGLTVDYTSPQSSIYGIRHAPVFRDERYSVESALLARIQREIKDVPDIAFTIDYVDLTKVGYAYDKIGIGDKIHVIYEPLNIELTARILEYTEYPEEPKSSIVTLSNIVESASDMQAEFKQVQKSVNTILTDENKVRYDALDEYVKNATKAINDSMTELEYPTNGGIIARDPNDSKRWVAFTSAGIGITEDDGQTFQTALTASGINADTITVGSLLFNFLKGGKLLLGGIGNGNGVFEVKEEDDGLVAKLNATDRGFVKELDVEDLKAPNVVSYSNKSKTYYVSGNGNDTNDGLSWGSPFQTIAQAISKIPKHNDGIIKIYLSNQYTYYENIEVNGINGVGEVHLFLRGSEIRGNLRVRGTTNKVDFAYSDDPNDNIAVTGKTVVYGSSIYETVIVQRAMDVTLKDIIIYGKNHGTVVTPSWTILGVNVKSNSYCAIENCEIYDVSYAIRSGYGSNVHVDNVKGLGKTYGLYAYSSANIAGSGTHPAGTTANQYTSSGGTITGTFSGTNSGSQTPPPPPETTTSWNDTGETSRSWAESHPYWHSNDVLQGRWDEGGSFGRYKGYWFFGSGLKTAVNGKTIKKIRVQLERANNSGYSNAQPITLRPHNYASKSAISGTPSYVSGKEYQVSFARGEKKWITLPTSFHSVFENGTAQGLMIYTTNTSNTEYIRMLSNATIEITYS